MDSDDCSKYNCVVFGHGHNPEFPSFNIIRTAGQSEDILLSIEQYAQTSPRTAFYIYVGTRPGEPTWSDIYAAILAGIPVCIPITPTVLAKTTNPDFITFSHSVFLHNMLRAVIYADSRAELCEPPCTFLKDCIVVPSHFYFELNAYHDFTYEPLHI